MPAAATRTAEIEESKIRIAAAVAEMRATVTLTRELIIETSHYLREVDRVLARPR